MIVEGNYEHIKKETLLFVNKKLSENIGVEEIILATGVFLTITELTFEERESILVEVIDVCEEKINQRRINVEDYMAHAELVEFISPF